MCLLFPYLSLLKKKKKKKEKKKKEEEICVTNSFEEFVYMKLVCSKFY